MNIGRLIKVMAVLAGVALGADRPTVFVTGTDYAGGSTASETSGHLMKACPAIIITLDRDKADYVVVRDDTGAGMGRKPQKVTVFNRDHELIFAGSDRTIAGAAKDACQTILKPAHKRK